MRNGKALCLNMIVKNEIANLERCLTAVAPYIACWAIGDTGSTDGTPEFIHSFFAERSIPGELYSFPFINFAQARNEALRRARASRLRFDYLLLTDADMELTVQDPAFLEKLTSAAYRVRQHSGLIYWNIRLLRRNVRASYKGVTHEYLDVVSGKTRSLEGVSFIDHATGSNRAEKYERDVRLLTNAIATERSPGMIARYTFYLANTLRDSGQKEAALETYLKRAPLGIWPQEVFVSLLNAARLKETLSYSNDEVISAYIKATSACPTRAEALHGAARFCRNKGIYERGHELATKGLAITYPKEALFVEDWIYAYGLLDELAINAYWTGRYEECVNVCDRLLSEGKLPTDQHERVLKNRNFAVGKLGEPASLESEAFIELLRAAREKERLCGPDDEVISAYLKPSAACPMRAEALHGAARFCRNKGIYERGYELAVKGLAIAHPKDALGVEDWIYDYGLLDELAINAYWTGRYEECVAACDRLLSEAKLPTDQRERVLKNKNFAVGKLQEIAPSSHRNLRPS
jgi:glycosyltransferase involved in cell wall biosynthesis